jgi:uncharacterized protein (DUF2147 family)
MRTIAALAAAAALAAGPAAAADITGVWASPSRGAHVRIALCGDETWCGTVLSATPARSNPQLLDVHNKDPNLRGRPVIGARLMDGFKGGPKKWTGGRLYNPGDGNYYKGALTLIDADHLELQGCAFLVICKGQVWTRVE